MEAVEVKAFPLSRHPEGDIQTQPQAARQGMSSRYSVRGCVTRWGGRTSLPGEALTRASERLEDFRLDEQPEVASMSKLFGRGHPGRCCRRRASRCRASRAARRLSVLGQSGVWINTLRGVRSTRRPGPLAPFASDVRISVSVNRISHAGSDSHLCAWPGQVSHGDATKAEGGVDGLHRVIVRLDFGGDPFNSGRGGFGYETVLDRQSKALNF